MRKIVLFTSMILALWACSNDLDFLGLENLNKGEKSLQIITRILTTKSTGFVQEFPCETTIGLHVTSGEINKPYNQIYDYTNVKATANLRDGKITWQQTPKIRLNNKEAIIYAYYPYQADIDFNARQVPVRIAPDASDTNDYMYGTHAIGQKAINNTSPVVLLSMNHALSLISFQLKRANSEDRAFLISSVQVGNKPGGTTMAGEGTMDISTGEIISSTTGNMNASTLLTLHQPILLVNTYCDALQLKVFPLSKQIGANEVEVLFTINGTIYKYEIPANTHWKKGKRYLYKLNFDGKSIQLEDLTVADWLPGNGERSMNEVL